MHREKKKYKKKMEIMHSAPSSDKYDTLLVTMSDRATKRVIAPYVSIVRKGYKRIPLKPIHKVPSLTHLIGKKPSLLLRQISEFLSDYVDLTSLLRDTANCMKTVTKAKGVHLYIVEADLEEIHYSSTRLKDARHKISWNMNMKSTIAAYVACTKEYVLLDDIIEDDRFPEGIGYKDDTVKSVLCVPIVMPNDDCFAVIELYRDTFQRAFDKKDLSIVTIVCTWVGAAIHQNQQRLSLQKQQELNDYLIEISKCYFSDSISLDKLISEIISISKVLMSAERGSFFTVDKDRDELVADIPEESVVDEQMQKKKTLRIRFNKGRGIAGTVARTGVMINVKDAYNDPSFNKEIDEKTGFITRSILCMPIIDKEGVLGVAQVINKIDAPCFSKADEKLFNTFTIYYSLALHFSKLNNIIIRTDQYNKVKTDMLEFHIKPCIHDVQYFTDHAFLEKIPDGFLDINWYSMNNEEMFLLRIAFYMMVDMIGEAELDIPQFRKFLLCIKKCHRANAFHNFVQGFYVLHCVYCILKPNKGKFAPLEIKASIIAGLCHNIDHLGCTNSFLQESEHFLTKIYNDSYIENHRYYMIMFILKKYDIFKNMSDDDYELFLDYLRDLFLATDIRFFFAQRRILKSISDDGMFDWKVHEHRKLLLQLIGVLGDYSYQIKPFHIVEKFTKALYEELYMEGDKEKEMGLVPLSSKDRQMADSLPLTQISFLRIIVLASATLLAELLPDAGDYERLTKITILNWTEIMKAQGQKVWKHEESIYRA